MPGKHHEASFASRHRYPLVLAVVLLCLAAAGVVAAVHNRRDDGTPMRVMPSVTTVPAASAAQLPSPSAPASATPSRLPSARRPSSRPPSRSPSATPRSSFTARYVVMRSRRSWFQAAISVTNGGRAARSWLLVVTHDPAAEVRLRGVKHGAERVS